jgi:hypothetical protein
MASSMGAGQKRLRILIPSYILNPKALNPEPSPLNRGRSDSEV